MKITVVICTWNRAALLQHTLAGMCEMQIPANLGWELLVVNNNCTDDTDGIVRQFLAKLPIRALGEPRQGLSNARNTAAQAASGELVIFTDDDVLVNPGWLAAYARAAQRWPDAAYFGGPIEPWYECTPPSWISSNLPVLTGMLGIRDFGPQEGPLQDDKQPFGANMGFRRPLFDRWRFNPQLGVSGGTWGGGEETSLFAALRQQGYQGIAVPEARIQHFIPRKNMTRLHLWNWAHGWGRSTVRMRRMRGERGVSLPKWRLYVDYVRFGLRYLRQRAFGQDEWAHTFYHVASLRGMLVELGSSQAAALAKAPIT